MDQPERIGERLAAGDAHAETLASGTPPGLRPVQESERIVTLDVLRGLAIGGIFFVNIQLMGRPVLEALEPIQNTDASLTELLAWLFIEVFCEYKFISLFSLLFGIGLVIQLTRAQAAGRPFTAVYLRRLAILAVFGLVHATCLWYGDILLYYAGCGLLLLAVCRLRAKTLLVTGLALFVATGLWGGALGAVQVAFAQMSEAAEIETAGEATPAAKTFVGSDTQDATDGAGAAETSGAPDTSGARDTADASDTARRGVDPSALRADPIETIKAVLQQGEPEAIMDLERAAYGHGPFVVALLIRTLTYLLLAINVLLTFLWRIVALFLIGAALMKLQFFSAAHRPWHVRCAAIGLPVGLALELIATLGVYGGVPAQSWSWLLGELLHYFASGLVCLGYVGAVALLWPMLGLLGHGLSAVGRTALSNYILQTLVGTGVMYWWGLGLFDTWGRDRMVVFVIAVFVGQMIASVLWLRVFTAGPLEWLWRTLTYLRPQPFVRPRS